MDGKKNARTRLRQGYAEAYGRSNPWRESTPPYGGVPLVRMRWWLPTGFTRGYRPYGNTPPSRRGYIQRAKGAVDLQVSSGVPPDETSFALRRQAPISSSVGTSIYSHGVKPVGVPACVSIPATPPNGGVDSRQGLYLSWVHYHQSLHSVHAEPKSSGCSN